MIRRVALLCVYAVCAACTTAPQRADESLPETVRSHPDSFIVVTVRNDNEPVSPRAGSTMRGYDGISRYSIGSSARSAVHALAAAHQLREVSSWPIAGLGIHCVVFELPPNESADATLAKLKHDARVESAQPLNAFAAQGSTYNDPYHDLQGNLVTMGVASAHRWSRGAGVRVAVIDTGVDTAHPDLAGRIAEHRNFVDTDARAFNHDRHGTAVAGVIAADSNNQIGIVGVAPEAKLHVYKACWQPDPSAPGAACNTFTLAKALAAAIDARVQIVNLSLAGPQDPLLTRLVVLGQQRGIVFVGATPSRDSVARQAADGDEEFPVGVDGVIKVAAIDQQAPGPDTLLAPGTEVLTLAPDGRYDFVSGSSLAAANVSGTIALLLARDRSATVAQLKQLLTNAVRNAAIGNTAETGVNACAALATLLKQNSCEPTTASIAAE